MFPIRNGLKQSDALSPFCFGVCHKFQVTQDGLKLNGTHQVLFYGEEMYIL